MREILFHIGMLGATLLILLSSCAVGSGASAISLLSYASENLTPSGEKKLIERVKEDLEKDRNKEKPGKKDAP